MWHSLDFSLTFFLSKLDVLHPELFHFDILAFTETWLNTSLSTEYIFLDSYNRSERKNRVGDSHGSVIIYVKGAGGVTL